MARKPISDKPMNTTERRSKSDSEKLRRGEMRLTTWLSPEAAATLNLLLLNRQERGAKQSIINEALLQYKPKKTKA